MPRQAVSVDAVHGPTLLRCSGVGSGYPQRGGLSAPWADVPPSVFPFSEGAHRTVVEREWIGRLLDAESPPLAGAAPPQDPELPFRDELLDPESLARRAREVGASAALAAPGGAEVDLAARAAEDGRRLRRAYAEVLAAEQGERQITSAGRWLLDNFHLIDEQLDAIAHGTPPLRHVLPTLSGGPYGGLPRVWINDLQTHLARFETFRHERVGSGHPVG